MIKKLLNKFIFSIIFALRSIMKNKVQTLILLIVFVSISLTAMLGISNKWIIKSYFEYENQSTYNDIDYIMSIDKNASTRYFSIRNLKENNEINDYVSDYASFFEMDVLFSKTSSGEKEYVNSMASNIENISKVTKKIPIIENFNNQEVIITKEFAKKNNFIKNQSIYIYIGDEVKEYSISYIIEDDGLFRGDKIFLNKESVVDLFLSALGIDTSIIEPQLLINIYNKVYFWSSETQTIGINESIQKIKDISSYSNFNFTLAYDSEIVDKKVESASNIINFIVNIILFSMLILVGVIFILFYKKQQKNIANMILLGADKSMIKFIVLTELFIILIVGFFINYFLTNYFIFSAQNIVGILQFDKIPNIYFIIVYGIMLSLLFLLSFVYFHIYAKDNIFSLSKEKVYMPRHSFYKYLILLFLVIIYIFSYFYIRDYSSIILSIFSIYFFYILITLLLILFEKRIKKINNIKRTTSILMLLRNKSYYYHIYILSMCFLSIFLLTATVEHVDKTINSIKNEISFEISLNSANSDVNDIYNEVISNPKVKKAEKAQLISGVYFTDQNYKLENFLTIYDYKVNDYYKFDFDSSKLENDQLSIALPVRFKYINKMNVGDYVVVNLGDLYGEKEFLIVDFFEIQLSNFCFSNLAINENYQYNSIMITAQKSDVNLLKNQFINEYGNKFIYVLDVDNMINDNLEQTNLIADYIYSLIFIMFTALFIALIGYLQILFLDIKENYNKLFLLGMNKLSLLFSIITESIFTLIITFSTSCLAFYIISSQITNMMILFNQYKDFSPSINVFLKSFTYSLFFYSIAKISYIISFLKQKEKILKKIQ